MSDLQTLGPLVPVRVEPEPSGGRKLAIVSSTGRLLCKVPSNRKSDLSIAEAIAFSINFTARALAQESP